MNLTLRAAAVSLALTTSAMSAQAAGLTIPFQGTQSNSVQAFSETVLSAFDLFAITVEAKGNATAQAENTAFSFPVTKIVINSKFHIASGSAVGSGLLISRLDKGVARGVTLANFTINYESSQVLADTTPLGGTTTAQMPLYNFKTATKLALKYKFPLTVTGHEVLNDLRLTEEAKGVMKTSLNLPVFALPSLDEDFGTLTQDISTNARKPAASTTPYVPQ